MQEGGNEESWIFEGGKMEGGERPSLDEALPKKKKKLESWVCPDLYPRG